jgi:hypothetical protein
MKPESSFRPIRPPFRIFAPAAILAFLGWFTTAYPASAQSLPPSQSNPSALAGNLSIFAPVASYFADWMTRATRIQSEQPHWITPLVTVTPLLEEEYRYDQLWQSEPHGGAIDNFGANKGLELIPWYNIEVILGVPGWIAHNGSLAHPKPKPGKEPHTDGWSDETFLVKYRLLSANNENGNYVVTAFMGFSAPTGDDGNSAGHAIFTPTIAFGKGWGNFDFQSTVSLALPDGGVERLSMPLIYNTAFQYHILRYFWPEFEVSYTWFSRGDLAGKNQVFLTPGIVVGIPIHDRIGLTVGAGYEVAVTHNPPYNHGAVLSARVPF